jgi:hypothetical protein
MLPGVESFSLYQQALWCALRLTGDDDAGLARRLRVPLADLRGWLRGVDKPPKAVFLAAVDIIVDPEAPADAAPAREPEDAARAALH